MYAYALFDRVSISNVFHTSIRGQSGTRSCCCDTKRLLQPVHLYIYSPVCDVKCCIHLWMDQHFSISQNAQTQRITPNKSRVPVRPIVMMRLRISREMREMKISSFGWCVRKWWTRLVGHWRHRRQRWLCFGLLAYMDASVFLMRDRCGTFEIGAELRWRSGLITATSDFLDKLAPEA